MPDVFTKAKRSDVMSRIRSRGNRATELALARVFRAHGITGWRRHQRIRLNAQRSTSNAERSKLGVGRWKFSFSVRPDFVFPRLKLAVFVDGCFWHACPRHCRMPAGNRAFWRAKLARNHARDRLVTRTLRKAGWRVLRIWEHDLHRATKRRSTKRMKEGEATPHPGRIRRKFVRRTSSGLRPPSPQSGEGHLPVRGGEGGEVRLVKLWRAAKSVAPKKR